MPPEKKPGFVLCLTYHLPNISGLTLSAHEIARYLSSRGHPVRVVAGRVPGGTPARETIEGIEVFRVRPLFRLGKVLVMPGYFLAVWRAVGGMDVVGVHLPCLDAAAVAIVAKLRGRKLILSYACGLGKSTPGSWLMRAAAALPHLVAGLLADRVQVNSADYAAQSTFCRLFRRKLNPAPPPLPLRLLPGERHPPREPRVATAERPYRIGYVGRLARQKGIGTLLDALPEIVRRAGPHVEIDLLGPSAEVIGETYWRDVLARVTASGGQVRYSGVKSPAELAAFYAGLDLLVLPSIDRIESFGLVQVEAMLRRVPVAASDLPGVRVPAASTGMGRLFRPGDPVALAEAAADLLANGPARDPGPEELERLFGHDAACAPYLELLAECAPPSSVRSAP